MVEVAKAGQVVPESVLKKQKRSEEWALAKKQESEISKKKKAADRKLIFNRAKQYSKEYEDQVWSFLLLLVLSPVSVFYYFSFRGVGCLRAGLV